MQTSIKYYKTKWITSIPVKEGIYFLPEGDKPFIVNTVGRYNFTGKYLETAYSLFTLPLPNTLHIASTKPDPTTKEDNMTDNTKTLYEYKITKSSKATIFGNHIATNSGGLWVMEEKGTGDIQAVDKSTVTKVVPNCVGVRFLTGANSAVTGTVYHYFAPKGLYKTGEMYTMVSPAGMSLVIIASEDCESDQAKKDFNPLMKILTEKVDKG